MIRIYQIADLHLGLQFQNHPEAQEILNHAPFAKVGEGWIYNCE